MQRLFVLLQATKDSLGGSALGSLVDFFWFKPGNIAPQSRDRSGVIEPMLPFLDVREEHGLEFVKHEIRTESSIAEARTYRFLNMDDAIHGSAPLQASAHPGDVPGQAVVIQQGRDPRGVTVSEQFRRSRLICSQLATPPLNRGPLSTNLVTKIVGIATTECISKCSFSTSFTNRSSVGPSTRIRRRFTARG